MMRGAETKRCDRVVTGALGDLKQPVASYVTTPLLTRLASTIVNLVYCINEMSTT